uniref:Ulp1 protease family, C-terminal catalytic domain containing protein n=1 Tax=Solanum tuberosum TaxID=4113 RepID=M1D8U6_SOLTU
MTQSDWRKLVQNRSNPTSEFVEGGKKDESDAGKIKHDGKYYRLYGFPLALQVWFYECCSNFDEEIVVKVSDHIPRILNWNTKKDFPRLEYFVKGMFRDDNNSNLSPPPMELTILELPPEYVQSDQSPTKISTANDSDDDFQDPPRLKNNKGKEKVNSCSSPPKKKSRQTVTRIQKKTPPRVISKQPCLRKSLRHANVPERPKSPLPKRQAKQRTNVASYTGIKQNVEIK